ncbi:MAG: efflux RND transporter periplasmic adaptor subunit, partial [Planctomycetota bacterium]|nr:efflux RND transporter periplasmic adaptor subunit [Planctomycetota bacterium]
LRPTITKAFGKKTDDKDGKGKKGKKEAFQLRFGYDQSIPVVDVSKPRRGTIAQAVAAPGSLSAGSEVAVGAPFAGTVLGLAVDEGDEVKKGDLIFALDPTEYQEQLLEAEKTLSLRKVAIEEAEAELEDANAKLKDRDDDGQPATVKEKKLSLKKSEISLQQSKARLETAESKAKRSRLLFKKGLGTEVEVESSEAELRVARLTLKIAKEDLQLARDALELEIENATIQLRDLMKVKAMSELKLTRAKTDKTLAELTITKAKRDLKKTKILAPMAGIITLRNINSGENINRNDSSTTATTHYIISNFSRMYVYADVDEGDIVAVEKEQNVVVRIAALGDSKKLQGKVFEIGNRAAKDGETLYFRVRILISKPNKELRPGMTANVEIETKKVEDVLVVPIQAVGQRRRRDLKEAKVPNIPEGKGSDALDVVFVDVDGKADIRIVELGLSDGDVVQIESGLKETEKVIVGPYRVLEGLQHGDPINSVEKESGGKKGKRGKKGKKKGKKNKGEDKTAKKE